MNGTERGISSQLYFDAASWTFIETMSGLAAAFSMNGRMKLGVSSPTSP